MNARAVNLGVRLFCAATLIFFVGCAHRLQFQMVDASTGNGLADVNVKVRDGNKYFSRKPPNERTVGQTDTNGFIIVSRVSSKQVISFNKLDYHGATAGFVGRGRIGFGQDPMDAENVWRQKVVPSDGVIVIPLLPKHRIIIEEYRTLLPE